MSAKVALITGATSGFGKEFAEQLAMRKYDLIITGRRKAEIQKVASDLKARYKVGVKVIIAELSKASDVQKVVAAVEKEDRIDFLINNAGYGIGKSFVQDDLDNELAQLEVHVTTPLRLIHAAVPKMIAQKHGVIINVCSMAAFAPLPFTGLYPGTKSFLHVFSEALHMEVRQHNITVQSLCPGFTHTDFAKKLGAKERPKNRGLMRWMEADDVVRISLKRLGKGVRCVPGALNKLLMVLMSVMPRSVYFRFMGGISRQMREQ
jgi:uncharacterized protein